MKVTSTYDKHKELNPNKPAIITEQNYLTYGEWYEIVQQTAAAFSMEEAITRRVALFLPNDEVFLQVFAGACEAGWASIIGDMRWKKAEIEARLKQTSPDFIIADKRMRNILSDLPYKVVFSDDLAQWANGKSFQKTDIEENVPFYIGFTSGSTGMPKAFIRSHESWVDTFTCNREDLGMSGSEHVLIPGSFVNSTFLYGAISTLFDGGTVYLLRKFNTAHLMRTIDEYPISTVYVVPTMIQAVINEEFQSDKQLTFISTGAKLLPSVKKTFRKQFPSVTIHEFYGASELSFVSLIKDDADKKNDTSVGKAFHNVEICIMKEDGEKAEVGEEGILYVKSNMFFDGYINNPVETKKVLQGDWATVYDIAKMDEAGYIYILGRKNDMILYGAYNIYPQEIEKVLKSYHGVKEAAVIGISDAYWGEKVAAFIEGDVSIQSLKTYCLKNLAAYKIPRIWREIDSFPETAGGKISRQELKKQFEQGSYV
ncbi:long-chain acyl-CoA synthetase [Oceanobacillus polygoni]|uniref:Long-chain acyl-CoA synthetase n=1 Tax=Oceanobacillus polygoni TaxID=1235259 RepID=A0A9X0YTQ3_9BACI|nr:AMP-binding protein [Oceanobacillus polygoni]MBP2076846.1 long-chain acyl-CoA synthetase [Oceanobacillus polygoni]